MTWWQTSGYCVVTTFRVLVEARARLELLERGAWWLEHRTKNPGLFEEEFESVVAFLEHITTALAVLEEIDRPGVRRKLMPRTRHHVYYVVTGDTVRILAVANARGRHPPDLAEE